MSDKTLIERANACLMSSEWTPAELENLIEDLRDALVELKARDEDAERYRWLRDSAESQFRTVAKLPGVNEGDEIETVWFGGIRADFLDAAIDAARSKQHG